MGGYCDKSSQHAAQTGKNHTTQEGEMGIHKHLRDNATPAVDMGRATADPQVARYSTVTVEDIDPDDWDRWGRLTRGDCQTFVG